MYMCEEVLKKLLNPGISWSDVLSIIAIIVSVGTVFFQYRQNNKINSINLNSFFFNNTVEHYLIEIIPEVRKRISFNKAGKLFESYTDFTDTLAQFKNDLYFFIFIDKKFYNDILKIIVDLDEYIVKLSDKTLVYIEQESALRAIDSQISNLYKSILDKKNKGNLANK